MAGEWEEMTLADVSLDVAYGYTESATDEKVGPRFLRITDIQNGVVNWANVPYCPISAENHQKYCLQEGDIVVARTGNSTGENYLYQGDEDAVFASYLIRFRIDRKKADPRFVWYNLRSRDWWNFINNSKTGSAQAGANAQILGRFPLNLPPLDEQHAIAHILGTLDDKIELNRRMNETLEAMARALFKSWFVDFDPVRAKAERRDPGLPKPLADLFPDSFEDSELGEIPKEWEVGALSDYATLNPETWSKDTRPAVINYVDLSNTKWGRIEEVTAYMQKDAPSRAQRVLRPQDTIIGTVRPGNGSYALVAQEGLTGSTGFAVLRPLKVEYAEFVYLAATVADNIDRLAHLADGAAYPAVRPEVVAATKALKAPDGVIEAFSRVTGPFLVKMAENDRESRTLVTLRDTLLPNLISGEVRVNEEKYHVEME